MVKLIVIIAHGAYIENIPGITNLMQLWNKWNKDNPTSISSSPPPVIQNVDPCDLRTGTFSDLFDNSKVVFELLREHCKSTGYPTINNNRESASFISEIRKKHFTLGAYTDINIWSFYNNVIPQENCTDSVLKQTNNICYGPPNAKWGVYLFDTEDPKGLGINITKSILSYKYQLIVKKDIKSLSSYFIFYKNEIDRVYKNCKNPDSYNNYISSLPIKISDVNDNQEIWPLIHLSIFDIINYCCSELNFWPTIYSPVCRANIYDFNLEKSRDINLLVINKFITRNCVDTSSSSRKDVNIEDQIHGLLDSFPNINLSDEHEKQPQKKHDTELDELDKLRELLEEHEEHQQQQTTHPSLNGAGYYTSNYLTSDDYTSNYLTSDDYSSNYLTRDDYTSD
jgi:hypothetical protein